MQERTTEIELTDEERRQRQIEINQPLIALLESWLEDDSESPEEQQAALDALMRGIDENRPEGSKVFSGYYDDASNRSR